MSSPGQRVPVSARRRVARSTARGVSTGLGRACRCAQQGQNAAHVPLNQRWAHRDALGRVLFPGPREVLGDVSGSVELRVGQRHQGDPVLLMLRLRCLKRVEEQPLAQESVAVLLVKAPVIGCRDLPRSQLATPLSIVGQSLTPHRRPTLTGGRGRQVEQQRRPRFTPRWRGPAGGSGGVRTVVAVGRGDVGRDGIGAWRLLGG